jgi:RimJ/RimL family protein N-acetyltransferase
MTAQLAESAALLLPPAKAITAFPELTRDEVFMIGTRRLWLRWARLDDADALARIGGDVRVASKIATWPVGAKPALARERIAKARAANADGTGFAFVIVRREAWDHPIGLMGFSGITEDNGLVATGGYHLDPDYWGRGYASEALAGVVCMIRLLTRIRALRASVMPGNTASARVLEKSGFSKVGTGTLTTEFRGTFPVVNYERRLYGAAAHANAPLPAKPA